MKHEMVSGFFSCGHVRYKARSKYLSRQPRTLRLSPQRIGPSLAASYICGGSQSSITSVRSSTWQKFALERFRRYDSSARLTDRRRALLTLDTLATLAPNDRSPLLPLAPRKKLGSLRRPKQHHDSSTNLDVPQAMLDLRPCFGI